MIKRILPSVDVCKSALLRHNKPNTPATTRALDVPRCGVCGRMTDVWLMALCASCKTHYHIACLDPPMETVPRGRNVGWQCVNCVPISDDE